MRVLISVAAWGASYVQDFMEISVSSQLSPQNIPGLSLQHFVEYHIITRKEDVEILRSHRNWRALNKYAKVTIEYIDDIFRIANVPLDLDQRKYNFLSMLQNRAIKYSVNHDVIIFNYVDFVWADGSLVNIVARFSLDQVKALLTFCPPVDHDFGIAALNAYRQEVDGFSALTISTRDCAALAVKNFHREAKLRYWDDPNFSDTPTYLLWRVADQGVIIRAYHQTILGMRVFPQDPDYVRGIQFGSLDGSYSGVIGDRGGAVVADDSREIFAFSLYKTTINTALPPERSRCRVMQRMLTTIPPSQRRFAEKPIYVYAGTDDNAEEWSVVAKQSGLILRRYNEGIDFIHQDHDASVSKENFKKILIKTLIITIILLRVAGLISVIRRSLGEKKFFRLRARISDALSTKSLPIHVSIPSEEADRFFAQAMELEQEIASNGFNITLQDESIAFSNALLEKAVLEAPLYAEPLLGLGKNALRQGRYDLALKYFFNAFQAREHFACACGMQPNCQVVLPANIVQKPELLGLMDIFLKKKKLEESVESYVILLMNDRIYNHVFLKYFSHHFVLVKEELLTEKHRDSERAQTVNWDLAFPFKGKFLLSWVGAAQVQKQWEDEKREPLLKLKWFHRKMLNNFLKKYGFSGHDWFVVLCDHGQPDDYYPAINAITNAGGWVIRMADTTALPIDLEKVQSAGKVIDYGRSPQKSPELDVALSAMCRLFITSVSGLENMARAFDRPCLVVNSFLCFGAGRSLNDILLPHRYTSLEDGRPLSFQDILSSPSCYANSAELCLRAGWHVEKASVALITETIGEILGLNGADHMGGEAGLKAFIEANTQYGASILGKPSQAFCLQYELDHLQRDLVAS